MCELVYNDEKLWSKAFVVLFGMNFCLFVSFHIQLATFSFFVKSLGADDAIVGLAAGVFSISSLLVRPFSGWLFDNKSKKMVFVIGLLGMLLFPFLYMFTRIIILLIFLRMMHGIVWSLSSTAISSEVVGVIPRKRFGEGMGYFGLTASFSTAIAPSLGIFVMNHWSFDVMFCVAAFMGALALLMSYIYGINVGKFKKKDLENSGTGESKLSIRRGFYSLLNKDALPASVTLFFCIMPHGAITAFIALYAVDQHVGDGGLFFTIMAVATVIMRLTVSKINDTKGEGIIVYIASICLCICMLLVGLLPGRLPYIVAALFFGSGFGLIVPAMQSMALRIVPENKRGAATSTYLCAFDLGIGIGGIASGLLVKSFGYTNMYIWMVIPIAMGAVIYFFWGKNSRSAFRNAYYES